VEGKKSLGAKRKVPVDRLSGEGGGGKMWKAGKWRFLDDLTG